MTRYGLIMFVSIISCLAFVASTASITKTARTRLMRAEVKKDASAPTTAAAASGLSTQDADKLAHFLQQAKLREAQGNASGEPTGEEEAAPDGMETVYTSKFAPPEDRTPVPTPQPPPAVQGQSCFEGFQMLLGTLSKPRCRDAKLVVSTTKSCVGEVCTEADDSHTCCMPFEGGWAAEGNEICFGSWDEDFASAPDKVPLEDCKVRCEETRGCHGVVTGNHSGLQDVCVVCTAAGWVPNDANTMWATGYRYNRASTLSGKKLCEHKDNETRLHVHNRDPPKDPCAVTEEKAQTTADYANAAPVPDDSGEANLENITEHDLWPEGPVEEANPGGAQETGEQYAEAMAAEAEAPRRRRRHPPQIPQDIVIHETPPPTNPLTVYYEDNAMWAPGKMKVHYDLCAGMSGIFLTGNQECQFHELDKAQAFCDDNPACTAVEQLSPSGECEGEFGCFVPRTGSPLPASCPGRDHPCQKTWVKQTAEFGAANTGNEPSGH